MSLSEQWTLKDKNGNPPPSNIVNFIKKLDKKQLLPCPRTADELQMPEKETVPREMNSFIVFRRQLAHVAKMYKTSDDGRVISTAASFIWNGASKSEKMSYTHIAEELKRRHRERHPNYTYERRKRKTAEEDFIPYDADLMRQNKNKKKRKTSPESRTIQHVSEEQKVVPVSTISQEQENIEWYSPTPQVDNNICLFDDCYSSENYHDQVSQLIRDEQIPQLLQAVTSINYVGSSIAPQQQIQEILLFQQQQEQLPLTPHTWEIDSFYYGNHDAGINQPSYYEGLERPIDDLIGFY
ncbi:hypothetical protein RclHR1_10630001 [Rhizophagus clarus]|uniref:Specific transcriptional repressor n=1 Tax=Rhizophagus clarus TaxID=94130 RepID=A0A2Z6Q227_9GLOM|nr:hypothetical protein RclHR1_10630001 [Rhizophagus clarus]GES78745.1 specific transcriptional repressor [Rhizophagus clarus]